MEENKAMEEYEELGFWNMKCVEISTRNQIINLEDNYLRGEELRK